MHLEHTENVINVLNIPLVNNTHINPKLSLSISFIPNVSSFMTQKVFLIIETTLIMQTSYGIVILIFTSFIRVHLAIITTKVVFSMDTVRIKLPLVPLLEVGI